MLTQRLVLACLVLVCILPLSASTASAPLATIPASSNRVVLPLVMLPPNRVPLTLYYCEIGNQYIEPEWDVMGCYWSACFGVTNQLTRPVTRIHIGTYVDNPGIWQHIYSDVVIPPGESREFCGPRSGVVFCQPRHATQCLAEGYPMD